MAISILGALAYDPAVWALPSGQHIARVSDANTRLTIQFDNIEAYSYAHRANTQQGIHPVGTTALGLQLPSVLDAPSGAPAPLINLHDRQASNAALFLVIS